MYLTIKDICSCDESYELIAVTAGCSVEKDFYSLYVVLMELVGFRDFFPVLRFCIFVLLLKDNNLWVDLFTKFVSLYKSLHYEQ